MTATHTDREGLLQYIIEHPDDDGPRLALADWLDEHAGYVKCLEPGCGYPAVGWNGAYRCTCKDGHVSNNFAERAEFIRVQCELVRYSEPHPSWDVSGKLARRSRELLSQFGEQWAMEELVRPCGWKLDDDFWINGNEIISAKEVHDGRVWIKWHYSRGFIAKIECTTETLMGRVCSKCNGCGEMAPEITCDECRAGRIHGIARLLGENVPVTEVVMTDAVIHDSLGNETCYVGNLGMFPKEYWSRLEGLPTMTAARSALARTAADYCRSLAFGDGVPSLATTRGH